MNNFDKAREKWASAIAMANPVTIGGTGGMIHGDIIHHNIYPMDRINSHDQTAANFSTSPCPEKLVLRYVHVATSLHGLLSGYIERFNPTWNGIECALYLSYHTSADYYASISEWSARFGVFFAAHQARESSSPALQLRMGQADPSATMIAVAMRNGVPTSNNLWFDDGVNQIGIDTSAPSWAAPILAGAFGFLKVLRPDITAQEGVQIFSKTANGRMLDMLAAADYVMPKGETMSVMLDSNLVWEGEAQMELIVEERCEIDFGSEVEIDGLGKFDQTVVLDAGSYLVRVLNASGRVFPEYKMEIKTPAI